MTQEDQYFVAKDNLLNVKDELLEDTFLLMLMMMMMMMMNDDDVDGILSMNFHPLSVIQIIVLNHSMMMMEVYVV